MSRYDQDAEMRENSEAIGREFERELFVRWLRNGCPGVDRAAAVAFHPATMPHAIADAVDAGALDAYRKYEGT